MNAVMLSDLWRRWLFRGVALSASVAIPLAAAEAYYRVTAVVAPRVPSGAAICGDCAYIYELNLKNPNVGPQGLRDREFSLVPPEGTFRMMVLGDSLPYGPGISRDATFPKKLEWRLNGPFGKVEVLNTGVTGYNTYNERQWWLGRGRGFHPRVVIVSFCLNDVADPLLHWALAADATGSLPGDRIPREAIPNLAYHKNHAIPELRRLIAERRSRTTRLLQMSLFYRRVVAPLLVRMPDAEATVEGKRFPTYLTGEDTLGIDVLMDYESVEWRWLRDQYDKLIGEIRREGADVVVLVNPVQYQLAPDYPFFPQRLFDRYCQERGIHCLDVMPQLRAHGGEKLFQGRKRNILDIWHYTTEGHDVVAQALAAYLEEQKLLPPRVGR